MICVNQSYTYPQSSSKYNLFSQDFKYMQKLGIDASWGYVDLWKPHKNLRRQLNIETLLGILRSQNPLSDSGTPLLHHTGPNVGLKCRGGHVQQTDKKDTS